MAKARIALEVIRQLSTDEGRKRLLLLIIMPVIITIVVIAIPIYIASNPLSYFVDIFGEGSQEVELIRNYKDENDRYLYPNKSSQVGELLFPISCDDIGTIRVSSPYGERNHPISGIKEFHTGIDLVGQHRAAILAVADGEVTISKVGIGYGNYIKIRHTDKDGKSFYSLYAHLSARHVVVNDKVTAGQVIGLEGGGKNDPNPGTSTGHHLHFELRDENDDHFDPYPLLFETDEEE